VKDAVQDVLTTKQASELLNMSASSVQKLVMSGELEAWVTPGGHRRIYRTSIERFAQQRQTPPPTIDPSRGFQILLAEDDPAQVFYMKKLLAGTRSPVELVIASDASQALIQIERHRPDLVITDLVMEPFDGFHLAGQRPAISRHRCDRRDRDEPRRGRSPRDIARLGADVSKALGTGASIGLSGCTLEPNAARRRCGHTLRLNRGSAAGRRHGLSSGGCVDDTGTNHAFT